jgi:hypothetical protein
LSARQPTQFELTPKTKPAKASARDEMRPRERRETGEQDLFRSRLDQIIDINHPLVRLARTVDWRFLEGRFGACLRPT